MGRRSSGKKAFARRARPRATPAEAARSAALRYVVDDEPGIERLGSGTRFRYRSPDGKPVRDAKTLARIRALAIPPAWTGVWICESPNGHLQATGRDVKRRKQYRYHAKWSAVRDEAKYDRLAQFAEMLPVIRERANADLARAGLPLEKLLGVIVRLLETTFIRIGNDEYTRANGSFGLTTLLDRHVQIDGSKLRFRFRGKSGQSHDIQLTDRRLARLVKQCRDVPGQELFQYLDDDGNRQRITSSDVNEYLRTITNQEFTAKDFRTWAGTLLAANALDRFEFAETAAAAKSSVVAAVKEVAGQLGNTAAVCRKCYIHPAVLEAFSDREGFDRWRAERKRDATRAGLSPEEATLFGFLSRPS